MADESNSVWNYVGIVEVTIRRPAEDVWAYFFGRKEALWTEVDYEPISGQPGVLGEVYMQRVPGGEFLYEAVKVMPPKRLVLKITFREGETGESRLVGYDFQTLIDMGTHTTVTLEQGLALSVDSLPADTRKAFELPCSANGDFRTATAKQDKMLRHIFENLKKVAEAGQ